MIYEEVIHLTIGENDIDMIDKMFAIYHGTAVDTSLLIDHLASYIFSEIGDPPIEEHLVMGVSLGVSDKKYRAKYKSC